LRLLALVLALMVGASAPAFAQEDKPPTDKQVERDALSEVREEDNVAVAVNTQDGASVFRLAFEVRTVVDGIVDNGNGAIAVASCAECTTVALAFQVVLVEGDSTTVTPENVAAAANGGCSYCLTYASATQLVIGVDGAVRLTGEGTSRLHRLNDRLRQLKNADLTVELLNAEIERARAELRDIFETQLVPAGQRADNADPARAPPPADATATDTGDASTTSTARPSGTSTTSTTAGAPTSTSPTTSTTMRETTTTSTTSTTSTTAAP
jgi:putative peptide zinc metalloprotease protein